MSVRSSERVSLSVPSDLRYGEAVRAMLDALSQRLEAETETVGLNTQVISAFNEAFNNVVEHAYGGRRTETVEIAVEVTGKGLTVALSDRGAGGFDLAQVEEPDLESLPEGGLGLMIIRSFMTRVEYVQRDGANVLTMTRDFTKPLAFSDALQAEVDGRGGDAQV